MRVSLIIIDTNQIQVNSLFEKNCNLYLNCYLLRQKGRAVSPKRPQKKTDGLSLPVNVIALVFEWRS